MSRRPGRMSWEDPSVVLSAGPVFARAADDDDPPPVTRAVGFAATDAPPADRRDPHVVELEAAVDRVRALHTQDTSLLAAGRWCPGCGQEVPCPTLRALNDPRYSDRSTNPGGTR